MNKLMGTVVAITLTATGSYAMAADVEAGKVKAVACAGCHGVNGISNNEIWPNLAGQKAGYLAKQIKAFRDGQRSDPMMSSLTKGLTDQDAENIAAYYATLK